MTAPVSGTTREYKKCCSCTQSYSKCRNCSCGTKDNRYCNPDCACVGCTNQDPSDLEGHEWRQMKLQVKTSKSKLKAVNAKGSEASASLAAKAMGAANACSSSSNSRQGPMDGFVKKKGPETAKAQPKGPENGSRINVDTSQVPPVIATPGSPSDQDDINTMRLRNGAAYPTPRRKRAVDKDDPSQLHVSSSPKGPNQAHSISPKNSSRLVESPGGSSRRSKSPKEDDPSMSQETRDQIHG